MKTRSRIDVAEVRHQIGRSAARERIVSPRRRSSGRLRGLWPRNERGAERRRDQAAVDQVLPGHPCRSAPGRSRSRCRAPRSTGSRTARDRAGSRARRRSGDTKYADAGPYLDDRGLAPGPRIDRVGIRDRCHRPRVEQLRQGERLELRDRFDRLRRAALDGYGGKIVHVPVNRGSEAPVNENHLSDRRRAIARAQLRGELRLRARPPAPLAQVSPSFARPAICARSPSIMSRRVLNASAPDSSPLTICR